MVRLVALLAVILPVQQVLADSPAGSVGPLVDRAVAFLKTTQTDEGAFSPHVGPAVTGIVATGLLRHGRSIHDPMVAQAVEYVASFVQEDGGVYAPGSRYRNYETCIAIQCFREAANAPGASENYADQLAGAEQFVKALQWDEEEGHGVDSMNYGGAGYGKHKRPDLSNTSFLLDALHSLGRDGDDQAVERALMFVSRSQNLESEHNTTEFAPRVNDGGFYYTPAAGGSSQAGETANGGLRSYGSMTYAGLKSFLYAGVSRDDPRVVAAYDWIRRNYTLEENPGMGPQGLYYYYHTFAKALDAIGETTVLDDEAAVHNWRAELVAKLSEMQGSNGAWVNQNDRWLEADPNLVTGYALLALSYCDE